MKLNKMQLRKLIMETILKEEKGEHVGETEKTDSKTADHIANAIVGPQKNKKPAFKIFPSDIEGHAGYDVHITSKGAVGGGLHGELYDPKTGNKLEGGIHIEVPGISGEKGFHAGVSAELSKAIMNGDLTIYAKGKVASHIESEHGKIHIGKPDASGSVGIHGTFGKHHDRSH